MPGLRENIKTTRSVMKSRLCVTINTSRMKVGSQRFYLMIFLGCYKAYIGQINYVFYLGLPGHTKHDYFRKYLDRRLSFN